MTITRYDYTTSYGAAVMEEDEDGEYVCYADHVAALSAIRSEQARPREAVVLIDRLDEQAEIVQPGPLKDLLVEASEALHEASLAIDDANKARRIADRERDECRLAPSTTTEETKQQWWFKELEQFWGDSSHVATHDTRRAAKTALSVISTTTEESAIRVYAEYFDAVEAFNGDADFDKELERLVAAKKAVLALRALLEGDR